MWLLYLSSRAVFSYFCTLCLASSPTMFASTKSISYSRMLRISRSSTVWLLFIWTPWDGLGLSPSTLLMMKFNILEVSSSSCRVPCKLRASTRKRHKLSVYRCLVSSSFARQLFVSILNRGSGKTASLQPTGTSLSNAAKTVKFVILWNLHFVFILFRVQVSITSVLLNNSFSFANSSLVHSDLDRSSRVLFSCA